MGMCDYFGCYKPICEEDEEFTPPTLRFCTAHSEESQKLIQSEDIGGLLQFWVKAGGGAERMAQSIVNEATP